jgi:hypothetical protein
VEYWHVKRNESILRVEKSSVDPRSVVDRGAARTSGVWSPRRMGKGSVAVPKICATGGGCGTVRNGANGCPTSWFLGLERSTCRACSGRSRRSTCLCVGGG